MSLRATTCSIVALALLGCARDAPADANPAYEVARETREGSLLKIDWKGPGRDADSGLVVDVPEKNGRRMIFISINLTAGVPMLWRSALDARLETGELDAHRLHTLKVEASRLVRVYVSNPAYEGDYFFKPEVGRDLDARYYVAHCSTPFSWEKGAVHCQTKIEVDRYVVEIRFDKAFLWDFDQLSAVASAAVKDYVAKPSTQRLIESTPKSILPRG